MPLSTRLANREHMERDNDAATQAQRLYALRQALPPEAWGLLDGKTLSGRTDAGMSDTDTEGKCSMAPMLSVGGEADG